VRLGVLRGVIRRQDLNSIESRIYHSHSLSVSREWLLNCSTKKSRKLAVLKSSWRGIQDAFGQSTIRGACVGDFVWYGTTCFPELFSACFSLSLCLLVVLHCRQRLCRDSLTEAETCDMYTDQHRDHYYHDHSHSQQYSHQDYHSPSPAQMAYHSQHASATFVPGGMDDYYMPNSPVSVVAPAPQRYDTLPPASSNIL
jgi:hypothetical protein